MLTVTLKSGVLRASQDFFEMGLLTPFFRTVTRGKQGLSRGAGTRLCRGQGHISADGNGYSPRVASWGYNGLFLVLTPTFLRFNPTFVLSDGVLTPHLTGVVMAHG